MMIKSKYPIDLKNRLSIPESILKFTCGCGTEILIKRAVPFIDCRCGEKYQRTKGICSNARITFEKDRFKRNVQILKEMGIL